VLAKKASSTQSVQKCAKYDKAPLLEAKGEEGLYYHVVMWPTIVDATIDGILRAREDERNT
jgi:hypothetical protein